MKDNNRTEHIIKQIMPCPFELWAVHKDDDGTNFSDRVLCLALKEVRDHWNGKVDSVTVVVGMCACGSEIFDVSEDSSFIGYSTKCVGTAVEVTP